MAVSWRRADGGSLNEGGSNRHCSKKMFWPENRPQGSAWGENLSTFVEKPKESESGLKNFKTNQNNDQKLQKKENKQFKKWKIEIHPPVRFRKPPSALFRV